MDRRIKYTKKIIKDTLIRLLNEKDINKITVSEICKIADINRATFYRYYLDVFDLLDQVREEFVQKVINSYNNDELYTVSEFVKVNLEIFLHDKELVKVLFNKKQDLYFLNDILEIAFNKCKSKWETDLTELNDEDTMYAALFIFNGALGVINYWIQNDFDKDIDEMSRIIENLSYHGIRKFIYKK